jgi:hypothetical protein
MLSKFGIFVRKDLNAEACSVFFCQMFVMKLYTMLLTLMK